MDFNSITNFVCAKVSKTDDYAQARCIEYVLARHKMIYESYDWKSAQIIVDKVITGGSGNTTSVPVPEVHHCLSVRLDGALLDPVSASYIFERATDARDEYLTPGTPRYYEEFFDASTNNRTIRFFPPLFDDGNSHAVTVLGKSPYNDNWSAPAVPQTESALIAFVLADMWELLHQVGKAQAKFQEGNALLTAAQTADTPGAQRPRRSRIVTPLGNSLAELAYSVCDIIMDWKPDVISMVENHIRRNYQAVWDSALFPETMMLATVSASGGIAILPYLMDKVVSVRINVDAANNNYQAVPYEDSLIYFGVNPAIFNQTGQPISYNLILPTALPVVLSPGSMLQFVMSGAETADVFVKGELNDTEQSQTLTASDTPALTSIFIDTALTISKPVTQNSLLIQDTAGNTLLELAPGDQERKYPRIQLFPAFDSTDPTVDQAILALGKRRFPQLLADGDTPQLSGIENILINAAAADIFAAQGKLPQVEYYRNKASSALTILIDRETKQSTYQPRILPYTEPDSISFSSDASFLG